MPMAAYSRSRKSGSAASAGEALGHHGLNGIALYFLIKGPDVGVNVPQALQLLMYFRIGSVQAAKLLQDFTMSSTISWFLLYLGQ